MTKTITMDYKEYQKETQKIVEGSLETGFEKALSMVKEYLESNKSFNKWYWKGRDASDTPHPYWLEILVALDREDEWSE